MGQKDETHWESFKKDRLLQILLAVVTSAVVMGIYDGLQDRPTPPTPHCPCACPPNPRPATPMQTAPTPRASMEKIS